MRNHLSSELSTQCPLDIVRSARSENYFRFAIIFWIFCTNAFLVGQENSAPTFRSNSRNVLLDVVVTDSAGSPVRSLTEKDFTVTENGVPQTLSFFEGPNTREIAPGPEHKSGAGPWASNHAVRTRESRVIILLDELNLQFDDLAYARISIRSFLAQKKSETPIALMVLGPRDLSLVQDFTTDRTRLSKAVSSLPAVLVGRAGGFVDTALAVEHANRALGALEQIARAAVGYPYRLNVIWLTSGFPELIQPISPDARSAALSDDYIAGMRRLASLLLQSRMSLYTVDPVGVIQESSLAARTGTQQGAGESFQAAAQRASGTSLFAINSQHWNADLMLNHLTQDTGGRSYYNRNDVDQAINSAIQDGSSAYTLAYSPSDQNFDGRYRTIQVRIDRPGTSARTRQGYYAVDADPVNSEKERNVLLKAALGSPLPYGGIQAAASSINYDPATRRFQAQITISPSGLIWGTEKRSEVLLMASLSEDNRILGSWSWQFTPRDAGANTPLIVPLDQILPTRTRRLRIVIADANAERIGTVDIPIAVH